MSSAKISRSDIDVARRAQITQILQAGEMGETPITIAAKSLVGLAGNSERMYSVGLREFAKYCEEFKVDVFGAQKFHIDTFIKYLSMGGLKASSVRVYVSAVKRFYKTAMREEYRDSTGVTRNPADDVELPSLPRAQKTRGFLPDEALDLIDAAKWHSPRAYAVVQMLLLTGMRVAELCGADVENLGWVGGERRLTGVIRKGGAEDWVWVPQAASDALDAYHAGRGDGPLILSLRGRRQSPDGVRDLLHYIARDAELEISLDDLHPHALRHTYATLADEAGVDLADIQDGLGHAKSETTEIYIHRRRDPKRSPGSRVAELLRRAA